MTNGPRPPAHVAPYVDALGADIAVRFFLHFGGADLYIARHPKAGSDLVQVVGLEGARALAAIRDQLQYRVPTAKPWIARHLALTEGLNKTAIARKLHASVPTVTRWLENAGPRGFVDLRQGSLF